MAIHSTWDNRFRHLSTVAVTKNVSSVSGCFIECLVQTMANNDLGASAFANVDEYFK